MLAGSMRYVKRNCWSVHGSSLAALPRLVNVPEWIQLEPAISPACPQALAETTVAADDN